MNQTNVQHQQNHQSQKIHSIQQNLHINLLCEDAIDEQGMELLQALKKHYPNVILNRAALELEERGNRSSTADLHPQRTNVVILYKKLSFQVFNSLSKQFPLLLSIQQEDEAICLQEWAVDAIYRKQLAVLYLPLSELQIKHIWSFWVGKSCCLLQHRNNPKAPPLLQSAEHHLESFIENSFSIPLQPAEDIGEYTKQDLTNWHFSPLQIPSLELLHVAYTIFILSGTLAMLSIDRGIFKQFLCAVQENYHLNPYHNFRHAVDSLQSAFSLYKQCEFTLKPLHLFALLIACLAHHIQHPGHNNMYLSKCNSALDVVFSGKSVLENYHSCILFGILRKEEFNFLSHLPREDFELFRKIVLHTILSTDMALHSEYVVRLNVRIEALNSRQLDLGTYEDALLFIIGLMKCADISNVARPREIAIEWATSLMQEFVQQGDREKSCGFTVSFLCDRSESNLPDSQISFIRDVAIPFYAVFDKLVSSSLQLPLEQMQSNLAFWKSEACALAATRQQSKSSLSVKRSLNAINARERRASLPGKLQTMETVTSSLQAFHSQTEQ